MQCKIDHSDATAIPLALCRACNPALNGCRVPTCALCTSADHKPPQREQSEPPMTRYAKRKLREVRAEVRELTHQLELMEKYPTPKTQLDAVKEKLRNAQRELYLNV